MQVVLIIYYVIINLREEHEQDMIRNSGVHVYMYNRNTSYCI